MYIIYISLYFLRLAKESQLIPLQNVVYFIMLPVLVRKIFTFYINYVLLFECPFSGPKFNKVSTDLKLKGSLNSISYLFLNFLNTSVNYANLLLETLKY